MAIIYNSARWNTRDLAGAHHPFGARAEENGATHHPSLGINTAMPRVPNELGWSFMVVARNLKKHGRDWKRVLLNIAIYSWFTYKWDIFSTAIYRFARGDVHDMSTTFARHEFCSSELTLGILPYPELILSYSDLGLVPVQVVVLYDG